VNGTGLASIGILMGTVVSFLGLLFYVLRQRSEADAKLDKQRDIVVDLRERIAVRDSTIAQYVEKAKDDEHVMKLLEQDRDRLSAVVKTQDERLSQVLQEIEQSAPATGPQLAAHLRSRLQNLSALPGPAASATSTNGGRH
jgi:lipoate-protein ligase A